MNRERGAARLREDFDRTFADAPVPDDVGAEDFLAIRLQGNRYALRLSEVSRLHRDHKVVPLLAQSPPFLGLASFRGATVPVFSLAGLLGYPDGPAGRWLVVARGSTPVGLSFDACDGFSRVAMAAQSTREEQGQGRRHVRGVIALGGENCPIIQVASVIEAIEQ